jgi:hypothetical protein
MDVVSWEDFVGLKGIYAECLHGMKLFNDPRASGVDEIDDVDVSIGDDLERIWHQRN